MSEPEKKQQPDDDFGAAMIASLILCAVLLPIPANLLYRLAPEDLKGAAFISLIGLVVGTWIAVVAGFVKLWRNK